MSIRFTHRLRYDKKGGLKIACRGKLEDHTATTWATGEVTCPRCQATPAPAMTVTEELVCALKKAKEHLEYIGYGDSWEQSCAEFHKLEQRIELALVRAKQEAAAAAA